MTERKLTIRKKELWIIISVFCLCKISYLTFISTPIQLFYLFLECLVIVFGVLTLVMNHRIEMMDILLMIFILIEFVSTVRNHGEFADLALNTEALLFAYVSCRWSMIINTRLFLKCAAYYFLLLTILNTITEIICYPNALFYYTAGRLSGAFLLGGDNTSTRLYVLTTLFCALAVEKKHMRPRMLPLFSIINFIAFSFIRDIGNGKVCALFLLACYIIFEIMKVKMPKNPTKKVLIVNAALFVILVIVNKINLFSYIIINLLHRDLTLTTRTTIWNISIQKILEHPILGNGYMSGTHFESLLPHIMGVNAHNTILMIVFIGGLLLGVTFFLILINATREYDRSVRYERMWVIPAAFMALFLRSQVEGADTAYLLIMSTILFNADVIEKTMFDNTK